MIKVGVTGVCGRMGARVAALVGEADDMQLVCALERAGHPRLGEAAAPGVAITAKLAGAPDVVIDFSSPEATVALAGDCAAAGCALVSGTTGLDERQMQQLRAAAEKTACLWSPNMSVGVNLLFRLTAEVARALGDEYDVEIVEVHHRFKKDAPSGTARRLAEKAAEGLARNLDECAVYGRQGIVGERTRREIGIHAVRAGDVVGEHTVTFGALGERIDLVHRAQSRDVFVRGAIRAARFLAGKPPGLYAMDDVLGFGG